MKKDKIFYRGIELVGYSMDEQGLVYGSSGKVLSSKGGKVTVKVNDGDGITKRRNIPLNEIVPVSDEVLQGLTPGVEEKITIVDTIPQFPQALLPVVEEKVISDDNKTVFDKLEAIGEILDRIKVDKDVLMKGINFNDLISLNKGNIDRESLNRIYAQNIFLFAVNEINVPNEGIYTPFTFNELTATSLNNITNSVSSLIHSPGNSKRTTAIIIAAIHSLLFNGNNNEFLIMTDKVENSLYLMKRIADVVLHMNNIPSSEFVIYEGYIVCNSTGNRITTFMSNTNDEESIKARAKSLTQKVILIDDYEFIQGIEIILQEAKIDPEGSLYSGILGGSTFNRNINPSTLEYLQNIDTQGNGILQEFISKDEITGYQTPQDFEKYDEEVYNSEIALLRSKPAITVDDIMAKTSLEWYTHIEGAVPRALSILKTNTMAELPLAVLDDIISDGVVSENEITEEIAGLYSIRYVNEILENGFILSKLIAFNGDDDALFATFGTNNVTDINAVLVTSANLHHAYMAFLRETITHLEITYGVSIPAKDLVGALNLTVDGLLAMKNLARQIINS